MKLLYTVIILAVIQLPVIKSMETPNNLTATSLKEILDELQHSVVLKSNQEYCKKAKILSENLLKDQIIQSAASAEIQEFKNNIEDFLEDYPSYEHYELFSQLTELFESKIPDLDNSSTDSIYIRELLNKHGYDEIDDNYENDFIEFIKEKYLPKFEELRAQLSPEELKKAQNLIDKINELKKCEDYACYYKYIIKIMFNPMEGLFDFIRGKVINLNTNYARNAENISEAILKDQRLSQLTWEVKENLIENINDFLEKLGNNQDVDDLNSLIETFYENIKLPFYSNKEISLEDQQLVKQIFDDHGYAKFISLNKKKFKDFLEQDLERKFEEMKADLSQEELIKAEPLFKWFDQTKSLQTHSEIVSAFEKLRVLEEYI